MIAWFKPGAGRTHLAPARDGVHARGSGRTEPCGASERRGPCPVEGTSFELNSAIELELRDRVVGSGSAQQAMLSAGPDPENPPIQAFGQNLYKKDIYYPFDRCCSPCPSTARLLIA